MGFLADYSSFKGTKCKACEQPPLSVDARSRRNHFRCNPATEAAPLSPQRAASPRRALLAAARYVHTRLNPAAPGMEACTLTPDLAGDQIVPGEGRWGARHAAGLFDSWFQMQVSGNTFNTKIKCYTTMCLG
ncbi:hypothetical protein evm_006142 [Chilo suppressalis]|nr:hypothetical protein evm_006142 [Chilo suppressalis]